jgi:hypothetical protein
MEEALSLSPSTKKLFRNFAELEAGHYQITAF